MRDLLLKKLQDQKDALLQTLEQFTAYEEEDDLPESSTVKHLKARLKLEGDVLEKDYFKVQESLKDFFSQLEYIEFCMGELVDAKDEVFANQ